MGWYLNKSGCAERLEDCSRCQRAGTMGVVGNMVTMMGSVALCLIMCRPLQLLMFQPQPPLLNLRTGALAHRCPKTSRDSDCHGGETKQKNKQQKTPQTENRVH